MRGSFVGRERELSVLGRRLRALDGDAQVVLVAGEPGVGKSRLAEEVAGHAAELGMACGWGRATREEGSQPYWVFHQVAQELGLARRDRPGDRAQAPALATSAAAVAESLGMASLHRDARELTAQLEDRPARPLTPREQEVAELVSQGLTNRQIAATAHISERTAESHVQHILSKLGFTSRAQIAAWVAADFRTGGR